MNKTTAIMLFFIIFVLYLFTLHPSISPYRDSGDLTVAAATVGLAHPPGYPLYVLCGKILHTLVPFGNTAYRMNVMSALFGAGTVLMIVRACGLLFSSSFWISFPVVFLFLSPAFWRLSQVSEMYSLNAFLAALVLLLCAQIYHNRKNAAGEKNFILFLLASFITGVAAANHETIIFLIPGILYLMWQTEKFSFARYMESAVFFALGLSVYGFLAVRFSTDPVSSWGSPGTFTGFLRMVTRSDYGGLRLHPEQSTFQWSVALLFGHLRLYAVSLAHQCTLPIAGAGLWGIMKTRKDRFFQALLISFLIAGPGFVILSNLPLNQDTTMPILEPHFVLPNLVFIVFVVAGLEGLVRHAVVKILLVCLAVFSLATHAGHCNYRSHFLAYDYGNNLLTTVEKNACIYNPDDSTAFICTYLQAVGKKRPDLTLIAYFRTTWGYDLLKKRSPALLPEREITSGRELERVILDYNRATRAIYTELPGKFPSGYFSYPVGALYRLSAHGEFEPSHTPFALYTVRGACRKNDTNDFFTNHIISYYASAHNNIGLAYASQGLFEHAHAEYLKALAIDPLLVAGHNNMGTLYFSRQDYPNALRWFLFALRLEPASDLAVFNLGLTYKALADPARAREYFTRAWAKTRAAASGNELGLLSLNEGDIEASIALFREVIATDRHYFAAYYNLGLALYKKGDTKESLEYFQRYVASITDPAEKQEVLRFIRSLTF